MKTQMFSVLLCVLCFSNIFGQTRIGINVSGGLGVGDAYKNFDAQLGVPVSFKLYRQLHLVTGLEMSRRNNLNQTHQPVRKILGEPSILFGDGSTYIFDAQQIAIYYLQLPLLAKIEGKFLTCQAGLVGSWGLFGTLKTYKRDYDDGWFYTVAEKIPNTETSRRLNFESDKIKPFDLALRLGWGFHWNKMAINIVTNHGLVNLNNNPNFNKMHNRNLVLSVDYFFKEK